MVTTGMPGFQYDKQDDHQCEKAYAEVLWWDSRKGKKEPPEGGSYRLLQFLLQILIERIEELLRIEVVFPVFDLVPVDTHR